MRTLVYGGSFNPPHTGHVLSLSTAVRVLKPDRIRVIPTRIPPHKALPEGSPTAKDRLAMTALAMSGVFGAMTSDTELRREGKSYTVDTLAELRRKDPGGELYFLLGTDMLLSLETWYQPRRIMELATIVLFARETDRRDEIESAVARLRRVYGAKIFILRGEPLEISSSEVREELAIRQGRELVPETVYSYIIQRRLYGARPELAWLRDAAYAYLKPKRIPHVQGAEEEAVRLAERWGESVDDAAEAAICHDITKKYPLEEQLRLCLSYGIQPDNYEAVSEKLLHAKTGAELAGFLFGLSEPVKSAIRWHTTGRPGMSPLEKIMYLADYIEPGRSGFDGLAELRRAAYEDLDLAMELGLRMSLLEVTGRGNRSHEHSIQAHEEALSALREKGLSPARAEGIPDTVDGLDLT